jgi:hypothetical protein
MYFVSYKSEDQIFQLLFLLAKVGVCLNVGG